MMDGSFHIHRTANKYTLTLEREGDSYVMCGGPHGPHSLHLTATDDARLQAHWDGYVRAADAADPPDPLEIPAFMDRRGEPQKRRTGERKQKARWKTREATPPTSKRWANAQRVTVHLDNHCPRLGCGRRRLWAVVGRKWVHLADDVGGRGKMKKSEFERVCV